MADIELDLLGLKCPLPALKLRKALRGLASGDRIRVTCNDPLAAIDIPNLIRETGDQLAETVRDDVRIIFRIVKI